MCSRALKRYLASDPRLMALFPRDPMACFFTKIFSTHCFRRTSGCVSIGAILNRLSAGHGQNPIGTGGSSFCETPGTGFWHELYSVRGGFEAMYVDVQRPTGFLRF